MEVAIPLTRIMLGLTPKKNEGPSCEGGFFSEEELNSPSKKHMRKPACRTTINWVVAGHLGSVEKYVLSKVMICFVDLVLSSQSRENPRDGRSQRR